MRFDQVKMLVRDMDGLVGFYERAIDCRLLEAPQDLTSEDLGRAVGAVGFRLRLSVLGLPGTGERPILELYQFPDGGPPYWPYRPGQGHLAFEVNRVQEAADRVVEEGGSYLGEVATWRAPSGNLATFVFMRDPEGNLIDLWGRAGE